MSGVFTIALVGLTLLVAVVLGSQEQTLVASRALPTTHIPATNLPVAQVTAPPSPSPAPTATALPTAAPTLIPTSTPGPLPTATVIAACPRPSGWQSYTVRAGDTIHGLALRYGTNDYAILQANCLTSTILTSGQRLYVPAAVALPTCPSRPYGWVDYTVRRGDTLSSLASRFRTSVAELMRVNCLRSDLIVAGTTLWVPPVPPSPVPTRSPMPRPTGAPTATATATAPTATPTETGSATPGPTATDNPATPTPTETGAPTGQPTDTPEPPPTDTAEPPPTNTPEPPPTNTPEPPPTNTPEPPPTNTPEPPPGTPS